MIPARSRENRATTIAERARGVPDRREPSVRRSSLVYPRHPCFSWFANRGRCTAIQKYLPAENLKWKNAPTLPPAQVTDGPDDTGEMFDRPGKLSDRLPAPYANEEGARYANNGAYPPDLSLITKARHDGQNYVFSLLLGYREPPAGVSVREGLHYNPYFPGGAIAMPKMLVDGGVEYDDGTPATETQMAKDVTTFLTWAAEPEHDQRKKMGMQWFTAMVAMAAAAGYYKRMRWAPLKTRKVSYIN